MPEQDDNFYEEYSHESTCPEANIEQPFETKGADLEIQAHRYGINKPRREVIQLEIVHILDSGRVGHD